MDEGLIALGLETALQAADVAGGKAEQPGGLGLGALAAPHAGQDLEDIALLLTHGHPVFGKHVDRHGSSLA
jgi:hypothetical protein